MPERVMSRRALLQAATVAGLGVPLLGACTSPRPQPDGGPRTDPVALAMHLHSSFSEGTASMATHLEQARRVGVDVLFWTDHDFRVSAQGYRRRLGLGGWSDAEGGVRLTWERRTEGVVDADEVAFAAGAAQLGGRGDGVLWLDANAWNSTYSGSLADTTVELELAAGPSGPDAHPVLQLDLSYHPAVGGRAAGRYRLTYRLWPSARPARRAAVRAAGSGAGTGGPTEAGTEAGAGAGTAGGIGGGIGGGMDGEVDVPVPGGWSTVRLRPVDDVRALWPDLVAEDNALHRLRVGLAVRGGATGRCAVRGIRLTRARRADSLALVRDVMARYAERYPDRRQYAALEVSLVRHLNWFGGELVMPDYGRQAPVKDDSVAAAAAMVEFIHRQGGLASYNHPLAGSREATAEHFVRTAALGADIVEVAYAGQATVESMLYVLDACARNLVYVTGNGVTDDHSGTDWYANPTSTWVTRVWAPSVELPDLQRALGAGRAWCYRPESWDGTLEMHAGGVAAMGRVAVTGQRSLPVTVTATGLPRDGALEVVTGLADRAAAQPAVRSTLARAGTHSLDLTPGSYVRAVVRDAGGRIVGIGNPTWVLPDAAAVPEGRRLAI